MSLSSTASVAAATAYCVYKSFFLKSFFSKYFVGSKSLTKPAILTFRPSVLKRSSGIKSIPETPFTRLSQVVFISLPTGVTAPIPVTTTLLILATFLRKFKANYIAIPPSTLRTSPVIYEASSEARKQIAFATSSGEPALFIGIPLEIISFALSES